MGLTSVQCGLCHQGCRLEEGRRGLCGVRQCRDGEIVSLVYGRVVAENVDPVEKKPFFHFLPGSLSYSVATLGCNLSCLHCQNSSISQPGSGLAVEQTGRYRSADELAESALLSGCRSISYTYVEPTVFFEYSRDCCLAGNQLGLKNLYVSNGYMQPSVVAELATLLDGINIDLKGFSETFYRDICGGRLAPVLENIRAFHQAGVWVEVTTLLIPGLNDNAEELAGIASFIADIDCSIPWHVTAFFPTYRMRDRPPTPAKTLARARKIGMEHGLHFVYAGNRAGSGGEDTVCPACGEMLISRYGFSVQQSRVHETPEAGTCPLCGHRLAGVW